MLPPVVSAPTACLVSLVRSRLSLCGENLALRHQLAVYKQTIARPRLRPTDRLLWAWLSRWWSGWQEDLAFVQPRTVLAWQRKRFRDHWRRLGSVPLTGTSRPQGQTDRSESCPPKPKRCVWVTEVDDKSYSCCHPHICGRIVCLRAKNSMVLTG